MYKRQEYLYIDVECETENKENAMFISIHDNKIQMCIRDRSIALGNGAFSEKAFLMRKE